MVDADRDATDHYLNRMLTGDDAFPCILVIAAQHNHVGTQFDLDIRALETGGEALRKIGN